MGGVAFQRIPRIPSSYTHARRCNISSWQKTAVINASLPPTRAPVPMVTQGCPAGFPEALALTAVANRSLGGLTQKRCLREEFTKPRRCLTAASSACPVQQSCCHHPERKLLLWQS